MVNTAYKTWERLFRERKSERPDRCIAFYDNLSPKEQSDVELIIARWFTLKHEYTNRSEINIITDLLYKESFEK